MSSSPSRGLSPRATKIFKRSVITLLVIANLAVFTLYWQLRTIESGLDATAVTNQEVVVHLDTPVTQVGGGSAESLTFLLIGSDSREGLDDLSNFGNFGGQRADVIMLLQLIPSESRAQILSLPRDLWVSIPGHGEDRINSAFAIGGAPLMVQTVKQATGVSINHYVEVDFVGFQSLVDELGGITMSFPYPARDLKSGFRVDAGTHTLDGSMALAYARSRTYQELRDGSWRAVNADDIGRTQRQQQLIFRILETIVRPSNLTETGSIVSSFARHLTIDAALAESSIVGLAFEMRGIRPSAIEASTLPTRGAMVGERSVVVRQDPEAEQMLESFRSARALSSPDGTIRLEVLNGNGIAGSAGEWSEFLEGAGFEVVEVGDAQRKDFAETNIVVPAGRQTLGEQVRQALGFGVVVTGAVDSSIDVLVILGTDVSLEASTASG